MTDTPLAGIRVLAMEQAVALPFATRHLADLGAEVIRVQSHKRGIQSLAEIDLTRNYRNLDYGSDLKHIMDEYRDKVPRHRGVRGLRVLLGAADAGVSAMIFASS